MKERDVTQRIRQFIQEFDRRAGQAVKKVVLPAALGLGMALAPGCALDEDQGPTRPQSARAAKQDQVNPGGPVALYAAPFPGDPASCADLCGTQAQGGCWCDDQCTTYNDCCDDKAAQCDGTAVALYAAPFPEPDGGVPGPQPEYAAPFPEPACVTDDAAYCGGQAPAGCWCDDECTTYNDCCDDKPACDPQALYAAPFPE